MTQDEIINEINILKQKPQLRRQERRYLEKLEGKLQPENNLIKDFKKPLLKIFYTLIFVLIISGTVWYFVTRPRLPPIDMAGHIEVNPPSHIMDSQMDESIQKHMLEHADGKGRPGVIIQYNCTKQYICEAGLVNKLKNLVKKYPENVYLAPGNYAGKIILTKLGQRKILSSFNEKEIADFINNK